MWTKPADSCEGEEATLLPKNEVERRDPVAASNTYRRVSLPAATGEVITMEPSLATRGLAVVATSSVAFHFTTPVWPTTAYSAPPAKYAVLSLPSAGELRGANAGDSCVDHTTAPLRTANALPLGLPTKAVAGVPEPSTGELVTRPAPVETNQLCTPVATEKLATPPDTPATNQPPLLPIAGVDCVALAPA